MTVDMFKNERQSYKFEIKFSNLYYILDGVLRLPEGQTQVESTRF